MVKIKFKDYVLIALSLGLIGFYFFYNSKYVISIDDNKLLLDDHYILPDIYPLMSKSEFSTLVVERILDSTIADHNQIGLGDINKKELTFYFTPTFKDERLVEIEFLSNFSKLSKQQLDENYQVATDYSDNPYHLKMVENIFDSIVDYFEEKLDVSPEISKNKKVQFYTKDLVITLLDLEVAIAFFITDSNYYHENQDSFRYKL